MNRVEALLYFAENAQNPTVLWSELCPPEQEDCCTINAREEAWALGFTHGQIQGEPDHGWEPEPADNDPHHYNEYLSGFATGQAIRAKAAA